MTQVNQLLLRWPYAHWDDRGFVLTGKPASRTQAYECTPRLAEILTSVTPHSRGYRPLYLGRGVLLLQQLWKLNESCYNMDAPWGHQGKWNKGSHTKTNAVGFHLCEVARVITLRETERMFVASGWGGGEVGSYCLRGTALQVQNCMKTVLWREGSNSCIMWMFLMSLNCTLTNDYGDKFCYVYFTTI